MLFDSRATACCAAKAVSSPNCTSFPGGQAPILECSHAVHQCWDAKPWPDACWPAVHLAWVDSGALYATRAFLWRLATMAQRGAMADFSMTEAVRLADAKQQNAEFGTEPSMQITVACVLCTCCWVFVIENVSDPMQ